MADTDKYVYATTDASSAERGYHNNPVLPDVIYIEEDVHHRLHRGLKSRQVAMIAIGGAIGMSARSNR
jgi:amino acid permease